MPGLGPVFSNNQELLKRAEYRSGLSQPKNELEIFCSLCAGRVFYRKSHATLYFVDAPSLSISDFIQKVFSGMNQQQQIKQLYMDEHRLIKAACSIRLTRRQKNTLLVALRMNGIHIDTA